MPSKEGMGERPPGERGRYAVRKIVAPRAM